MKNRKALNTFRFFLQYIKKYSIFIELIILIIVTCCLFLNTYHNQLTNFDDDYNIITNPYIRSLTVENIKAIFTKPFAERYMPLPILSFAITYHYSGLQPELYHVTNIALHLFNIIFVFIFVYLLTKNKGVSLFTATAFAIHPHSSEAISWISNRNGLLYAFFYLQSLIVYILYVKNKHPWYYIFSFILFLLSCFSKINAVMLPAILLLIDYLYKRKNIKKILLEKLPFIMIAIILVYIAFISIQLPNINDYYIYTLFDKVYITSYLLITYIIRVFFPSQTLPFNQYPVPGDHGLPLIFPLSFLIIFMSFLIIGIFFKKFCRLPRLYHFSLLFFIVNISIHLEIVSSKGGNLIGERYTYIPYIGLFIIIGSLIQLFKKRIKKSVPYLFIFWIILAGYFCYFSYKIIIQNAIWHDSTTLWKQLIKIEPNNFIPYARLAVMYQSEMKFNKALEFTNQAINLAPQLGFLYEQRGIIELDMNNFKGAYDDFTTAINMNGKKSLHRYNNYAYFNRGLIEIIYFNSYDNALRDYNAALELDKTFAGGFFERGSLYMLMNMKENACADFKKASSLGLDAQDFIHEACN